MNAPRIYLAISAITAELARTGIAKTRTNTAEDYAYRGIDQICNRLAPLLARYKVCILPRVLERNGSERSGLERNRSSLLTSVELKVAFDFVSARDGSRHVVQTFGEALDEGDKATSKAMTAAYKQALLQTFCIPVDGLDDPDAKTYRVKPKAHGVPDPDQGWDQWCSDFEEMIRICQSGDALDRVQQTYHAQLRAASKRRPEIFKVIGEAMRGRRDALAQAVIPKADKPSATRPSPASSEDSARSAANA